MAAQSPAQGYSKILIGQPGIFYTILRCAATLRNAALQNFVHGSQKTGGKRAVLSLPIDKGFCGAVK
ncbi:hypothetical protein P4I20_14190 [Paenibacillus graminis]